MAHSSWDTATALLRLSALLVDGIQEGLADRGYPDVRPAHGFAFVRLAAAPATTVQLAEYLGISKQATSELVQHLVDRGFLTREVDPRDRRSRLLTLTERGHDCTRAAEQAAAETVDTWRRQLAPQRFADLQDSVRVLAGNSSLRPPW